MATPTTPIEFTDDLRVTIGAHLDRHDRIELPLDGRRHAAVAIVVVDSQTGSDHVDTFREGHGDLDWDMSRVPGDVDGLDGSMTGVAGGASFVLCRRSAGLRAHAAQWALPGGRVDQGETMVEAALRETHEEIGIDLDQSSVLGLLDDYGTRSGYVMTPVVVWGGAVDLVPNPDEVLAAYRIGLHELGRADSPRFVSIPESDRPVVQIPLGRDLIHAPTGAVLAQFRYVAMDGLTGDDCRVAEFEQPVFAWG